MLVKSYYFDIGGTPVDPVVQKEILAAQKDNFANPEALHSAGQAAFVSLQKARERLAKLSRDELLPSAVLYSGKRL